MGDNVNYYKRVHHPIPPHGNRKLSFNFQNKSPKRDYPKEHLFVIRDDKISPFVKFEIIVPLLCFY